MNGWTEDDATDVRTRDLAERQRRIMDGARPWGTPDPQHYITPEMWRQATLPRRIDWPRVAVFVGMCLLSLVVTLGIGAILVYVLTAF